MRDMTWQIQEIEYGAAPPDERAVVSLPTEAVNSTRARHRVRARLRLLLRGSSPVDAVRIIDGTGHAVAEWSRLDEIAMRRDRSSAVSLID